jgi:phosphomannomutase
MHTVKDKELHYGIEITASHNPANYNGIKLFVDEGRDAPVEVTSHLEELITELNDVQYDDFDAAVSEGKIEYLHNKNLFKLEPMPSFKL